MDGNIYRFYPMIFCPHCKTNCVGSDVSIKYSFHDYFVRYFQSVDIKCTNAKCGKSLDWWEVVYKSILFGNEFSTMAILGAESTVIRITMMPHNHREISLGEYGIPMDASILDIFYTHYDKDFFAVEADWYRPKWLPKPHVLKLYAIPNEKGVSEEKPFDVSVLVTWILDKIDEGAWQNLMDAFRFYLNHRYELAIIPANTAVESTMSRLMKNFLERFISKKKVGDFFASGDAKYSNMLKLWLPLSVRLKGTEPLCDSIYDGLDTLRKRRNEMGHDGKLERPINENEIAKLICAALFGFHYLKFIEPDLLRYYTVDGVAR